jgi:hypothetical protein
MMTGLSLEIGPQEAGSICDYCGTRTITVHGFVYESGDAFAIDYAGWSVQHPERGVTMAIANGEWSEGSGPASRVSIGVQAHSRETEIYFSVLEPSQSPGGETELFGEILLPGQGSAISFIEKDTRSRGTCGERGSSSPCISLETALSRGNVVPSRDSSQNRGWNDDLRTAGFGRV